MIYEDLPCQGVSVYQRTEKIKKNLEEIKDNLLEKRYINGVMDNMVDMDIMHVVIKLIKQNKNKHGGQN